MPQDQNSRRIFVSYAHEDRPICERLLRHLGGLTHSGKVKAWSDREIVAGSEWDAAIRSELEAADLILLLISADFIGSSYCQTVELTRAVERHDQGLVKVIPILVGPCDWASLPISKLQALPKDEKLRLVPLSSFPHIDEPLAQIAKSIRTLVEEAPMSLNEAPAPFVASSKAPATLPKRLADFVGRKQELARIEKSFRKSASESAIWSIVGIGGIGKTQLAIEAAHRLLDLYPQGIVFRDLHGFASPADPPHQIMAEIIRDLGHSGPVPEDPGELYRNLLEGRQILLILDNAKDAAQIEPLLPPAPVDVLITSRHKIWPDNGEQLDLGLLPADSAATLLAKILANSRKLSKPEIEQLSNACGRLPLALRAAAGFLRKKRAWDVASYLSSLKNARNQLDDVPAVLGFSVESLADDDPKIAKCFFALTVFRSGIDIEAAAAVWDASVDKARDVLDALYERSLLQLNETHDGHIRFGLLNLVRQSAKSYLTEDQECIAKARHATYFCTYLRCARDRYLEGGDGILEGLQKFDIERRNIETGQNWAAEHWQENSEARTLAADYPQAGAHLIQLRLTSSQQISWYECMASAARLNNERPIEGAALNNWGLALARLERHRDAIDKYGEVLEIAREIGSTKGEADALGNIGNAYSALGRLDEAVEHLEADLKLRNEIGDERGETNALSNLGITRLRQDQPKAAVQLFEQALANCQRRKDRRGEAQILGNLGSVCLRLDRLDEAEKCFRTALGIATELGGKRGEAVALWNLALVFDRKGDAKSAIDHAKAALAVRMANELGNTANIEEWLAEKGAEN